MPKCNRCKEDKHRDQFEDRPDSFHGRYLFCIPCRRLVEMRQPLMRYRAKPTRAQMVKDAIESSLTGQTLTCTKCGKEKDEAYFHKNRNNATGRLSSCKECCSAADAERYALKNDKNFVDQHKDWHVHKGSIIFG